MIKERFKIQPVIFVSGIHRFARFVALFTVLVVLSACWTSPLVIAERHNHSSGSSDMEVRGDCDAYGGSDDGDGLCRACIPTVDTFKLPPSTMLVSDSSGLGPVGFIVTQMRSNLETATEEVLRGIIDDPDFKSIAALCMALVIIFYSISVMFGGASPKPMDMLTVLVKIIIVFGMVTNYDLMKTYTQDFGEAVVTDASVIFLEKMGANEGSTIGDAEDGVMKVIDQTLNMFFSIKYMDFLVTMALSGFMGMGYVGVMLFLFTFYVVAIIRVVYLYLLAMIIRFFLYALAPLFFLGLMFERTRSLFDAWFRQVLNFVLQAIFLILFVSVLHLMLFGMLGFMASTLADEMCYMYWTRIWGTDIGLFRMRFSEDGGNTAVFEWLPSGTDIMINIPILVTACILCLIMFFFCSFVQQAAAHLSSGAITVGKKAAEGWGSTVVNLGKTTGITGIKAGAAGMSGAGMGAVRGGVGTVRRNAGSFVKALGRGDIKEAAAITASSVGEVAKKTVSGGATGAGRAIKSSQKDILGASGKVLGGSGALEGSKHSPENKKKAKGKDGNKKK